MTKKPHHSDHPVFMNSPAQTAIYIHKELSKNKVTNTHVRILLGLINTWHM